MQRRTKTSFFFLNDARKEEKNSFVSLSLFCKPSNRLPPL